MIEHLNQHDLFDSQTGCIHLNNCFVHFFIRKNNRIKRERLLVSPEEGLVIEAPRNISLKQANRLILNKKDWILKTLEFVNGQKSKIKNIKTKKNSVLVFGQEKNILPHFNQKKQYVLEKKDHILMGYKEASLDKAQLVLDLNNWLKDKATRYLPLRTHYLNKGIFDCNNVFVRNQKTIWGSCNAQNNIHFSWRLIMAPPIASDYIILHELCHTRHLNHSKKYWQLVERVFPAYEKAEKWFQSYGFVLHIDPVFNKELARPI
ncbi:M48 family metallopeptidase, partial [bacterium]|nr:M48 family metallopeptidase [bacterium]